MALKGGCQCGGVRYEIQGQLRVAANCHCSICRKQSGGAFLTGAGLAARRFTWVQGEDLLTRYESSPGVVRIFCKRCGSTLAGGTSDPSVGEMRVMMGTLDDDPGIKPSIHIFVGSKAPWFDITDDLPRHEEFPKLI